MIRVKVSESVPEDQKREKIKKIQKIVFMIMPISKEDDILPSVPIVESTNLNKKQAECHKCSLVKSLFQINLVL
jgi:hypothetical protein